MTNAAQHSGSGTAYQWDGPQGAPVVVLIHGLGLNRSTWSPHLPALGERYRVLTYDLVGHGQSAKPQDKPTLSSLARQLRDLLDEVDVHHCALVGFSLGGMINRRFAMDYPSRVSALCVLNSPHERTPEAQKVVEERAAQSSGGGPAVGLETTIERWFTTVFRRDNPDVIAQVREWVLANDPQVYADCRAVLARGVTELVRPQPPIVAPTLVLTCEHDTGSTPAMTYAIASEIAGARAMVVPHLQHMGLMEEPELIARHVLRFLDDVRDLPKGE